jgi:hypothetical protein
LFERLLANVPASAKKDSAGETKQNQLKGNEIKLFPYSPSFVIIGHLFVICLEKHLLLA